MKSLRRLLFNSPSDLEIAASDLKIIAAKTSTDMPEVISSILWNTTSEDLGCLRMGVAAGRQYVIMQRLENAGLARRTVHLPVEPHLTLGGGRKRFHYSLTDAGRRMAERVGSGGTTGEAALAELATILRAARRPGAARSARIATAAT